MNVGLRFAVSLLDRFGRLITYATLFEREFPTHDDLIARLAQLDRHELILRIAWANALGHTWQSIKDTAQDRRVRDHLFPFWSENFARWERRWGEGFLFSRFTTLWLLRQALTHCPANAGRPTNEALVSSARHA